MPSWKLHPDIDQPPRDHPTVVSDGLYRRCTRSAQRGHLGDGRGDGSGLETGGPRVAGGEVPEVGQQFGRPIHGEVRVEQSQVDGEGLHRVRAGVQPAVAGVEGFDVPAAGLIRSATATAGACTVTRAR